MFTGLIFQILLNISQHGWIMTLPMNITCKLDTIPSFPCTIYQYAPFSNIDVASITHDKFKLFRMIQHSPILILYSPLQGNMMSIVEQKTQLLFLEKFLRRLRSTFRNKRIVLQGCYGQGNTCDMQWLRVLKTFPATICQMVHTFIDAIPASFPD